eukprot:9500942-Pyramimonas_sp.AAC.2
MNCLGGALGSRRCVVEEGPRGGRLSTASCVSEGRGRKGLARVAPLGEPATAPCRAWMGSPTPLRERRTCGGNG